MEKRTEGEGKMTINLFNRIQIMFGVSRIDERERFNIAHPTMTWHYEDGIQYYAYQANMVGTDWKKYIRADRRRLDSPNKINAIKALRNYYKEKYGMWPDLKSSKDFIDAQYCKYLKKLKVHKNG